MACYFLATPNEDVEFEENRIIEKINHNERFSWDNLGWVQGRAGFGPNGRSSWNML